MGAPYTTPKIYRACRTMTQFQNRRDAGQQLGAKILGDHKGLPLRDAIVTGDHKGLPLRDAIVTGDRKGLPLRDVIVLGIPRGGVVVAAEIARVLHAPLDVFIVRKIRAPFNKELALGAVASDGTVFLDQALIHQLHIPQKLVELECENQKLEIQRRLQLYRRNKTSLALDNKIAILVDDGIATGATTIAALRALKHSRPARVILAVPVAPRQVVKDLRAECDELVLLDTPEPFVAVGHFYEDFEQIMDSEVVELLERARDQF